MILEARLKDDIYINIDAEASGSISKGGHGERSYPDQALDNMITLAQQIAERLHALSQGETAPDTLEVSFGVKVDSNAVVSLSRDFNSAQLKVTARWSRDDD